MKGKEKKENQKTTTSNPLFSRLHSFQFKVTSFVILCVIVSVAVTVLALLNNTKNLVINSSLGKMLNIATSYGKIIDNAEQGETLSNEEYAALLSDLKIDDIESSYCFLLNKSGIITYHADASKIGRPNDIPFITELIGNMSKGVIPSNLSASYEQDGVTIYCSYYITASKSVLVVCANGNELMNPLMNSIVTAVIILLLILVIASLISNIIVYRISKPLEQVTQIINDASNLKFILPDNIQKLCSRKDETGQISRAVDNMCHNLSDVVSKIEQANQSIEANMEQLESSSNQVHIFCTDNSATSEELAASMEETSAMTETINNHMIRMREQSEGINDETANGTLLSEEISERAKALQETTLTAITNTREIYEKVKDKTQIAIEGLQSVSKINELTNAIKEISDQTSLLSLNASIEAARAGEAGRGFAVVASEISNLAHRSLESVNDINMIISEVNTAVANMSDTLEETLAFLEGNVLTDYDNFNHVGDQYLKDAEIFKNSMVNISNEITELYDSIQDVASSLNDIKTTIGEASIGVTDIAEKTSETVVKASANYTLSGNTKESVNLLKQIVEKFEL